MANVPSSLLSAFAHSKLICFGCRGTGHSLRDCRITKGGGAQGGVTGVKTCFNCGKNDHAARDCKLPNSNFKFAVCFTCGETGGALHHWIPQSLTSLRSSSQRSSS